MHAGRGWDDIKRWERQLGTIRVRNIIVKRSNAAMTGFVQADTETLHHGGRTLERRLEPQSL